MPTSAWRSPPERRGSARRKEPTSSPDRPRFGVCYYPEQWPEERWAADATAMARMGLELVRIGEFAWSSYEPARERFEWGWLDRAIDTLARAGLGIVLATPTAAPPVWLCRERPDILGVDALGRKRPYGSRRHVCATSLAYREESARICTALADRYAEHAAVVAWQVDNEPGAHDSARCWCGECAQAFVAWLRERFGSIAELNRAWGTEFWSQTYPDFESVSLPKPTVAAHHPALLLAHRVFTGNQLVEFLSAQAVLIGERHQGPLFANLYPSDVSLDPRALLGSGLLPAIDNYPHGQGSWADVAYHLDLAVSAANGGAAWIAEQQCGPIHWARPETPVDESEFRVWIWQAALHGIDTLLFFRWRAARTGQEIFHSALLRADGTETRIAQALPSIIEEVRAHRVPRARARVALLHSQQDVWALEVAPLSSAPSHRFLQLEAYRAIRSLGFEVEIVDPEAELAGFELIVAPALIVATPARLRAIEGALDAGSRVVLGARSLTIDQEYTLPAGPVPAGLCERLGASVDERVSAPPGTTVQPFGVEPGPWTDLMEVQASETLATLAGSDAVDGRPVAVTRHGLTYAGVSSEAAWRALLGAITARHPHVPEIEIFERGPSRVEIDHADGSVRL